MTTFREKRRGRRIASDEAHSWARNLRLKNQTAKMILLMLAGYINSEGECFVGIPTLAEDCEVSTQTIRDRLGWLEDIGAIARTPQFIDANGHRNTEGRGRRTSDLIRLMIELDEFALEERAARDPQKRTESDFDPQAQTGSKEALPSALPSSRPYDSVEGLISEQEIEPESTPNPSRGGAPSIEPECFEGFWNGYPGREVMSRQRALEVFVTMTAAEQEHARAVVAQLASTLEKLKRKPRDAHKWLAERGWREFQIAKSPPAQQTGTPSAVREIAGDELAGLRLATRIGDQRELVTDRPIMTRKTEIQRDLAALAPFVDLPKAELMIVQLGTPEFAAWRDRLKAWLGLDPSAERIWLEPLNPAVHNLPPLHKDFRLRKSVEGFRVPRQWPPRRDGSWGDDQSEGAA